MEGKAWYKVQWRDGTEVFKTFDDAIKFAIKIPLPITIWHYKDNVLILEETLK